MDIQATLVDLPSDATAVSLTLTLPSTEKQEDNGKQNKPAPSSSASKWVIIVLDNSGSMAGSGIKHARLGITELVTTALKANPALGFTVMEFNSNAKVKCVRGSDANHIVYAVNMIEAGWY
jgi:uncharacterized protein with von Willebrand factor type A (vWA) domain